MILRDVFIGNYPITQKFGENFRLANGNWAYKAGHMGVDFGTPKGTKLVAPTNGEVIRVGDYKDGYGIQVQVWDKEQGIAWRMGHLEWTPLKIGEKVWTGKLLGTSDNTGFSTGNHLHFEVAWVDANCKKINGQISGNINPLPYFRAINLQQPIAEDPVVVAQRKAAEEELARQALEKAKIEEANRLAQEAAEKARLAELARQEEARRKAEEEEKASQFDDLTTLPTEPPYHAENLDIKKVMTIFDQITRVIMLLRDLFIKIRG